MISVKTIHVITILTLTLGIVVTATFPALQTHLMKAYNLSTGDLLLEIRLLRISSL